MNLLDLMRAPMIVQPVDAYGHVVQGDPEETLTWSRGYRFARIELHRADGGLWMWATGFSLADMGCGYKVGAKWGRFAVSRDDALHYAVCELTDRLSKAIDSDKGLAIAWAGQLR
jgi:hypothetical protein